MRILPINQNQQKRVSFKGNIDKCVINYIETARKHYHDPSLANVKANQITEKLMNFMRPLHKDTYMSLRADTYWHYVSLPFGKQNLDVYVSSNSRAVFYNKKINKIARGIFNPTSNEINISENYTCISDAKGTKYKTKSQFVFSPTFSDSLDHFENYVDDIINFFKQHEDEFNVDNLLYTNGRTQIKHNIFFPWTRESKFAQLVELKNKELNVPTNKNWYLYCYGIHPGL